MNSSPGSALLIARRQFPQVGIKLNLLLAALLLMFGCIPAPTVHATAAPAIAATPAAPSASATEAPATSVAAYKRLVHDLADDRMEGRGAGTKGLDLARDYLIQQMEDAGLEPAFRAQTRNAGNPQPDTAEHDSDAAPTARQYTQSFDIPTGLAIDEARLEIPADQNHKARPFKSAEDFTITGMSPNHEVKGEAVWIGYGVKNKDRNYDSYTLDGKPAGKEALKGKIAVCYRYEPIGENNRSAWAGGRAGSWSRAATLLQKAQWAADHGAEAILFVNPPSHAAAGMVTTSSTAGPRALIPVIQISFETFQHLLRRAGRDSVRDPEKLQKAANAGSTDLQPLGITLDLAVKLKAERSTIANVAGVLPGRGDLKDQYIVVGGHYDHLGYGGLGSRRPLERAIHPGADDNASGTAGVIMIARILAQHARQHPDANRRSVLFICFSGEERGLLGSQHFVTNLEDAGLKPDQIVAMVNLDMIGRVPDDQVTVGGVRTGDRWDAIIDTASKDLSIRVHKNPGGMGGSDHIPFQRRRIPVLFLFTGLHNDYHTPADTPDKINPVKAMQVVTLAQRITRQLMTDPQRMAFQRSRDADRPFLGIQPGGEHEKGFVIGGLVQGGPADTAGLQQGDVITAWDGKPLGNMRDLINRLGEHKPGDKIELTVLRGDAERTHQLTLGSR